MLLAGGKNWRGELHLSGVWEISKGVAENRGLCVYFLSLGEVVPTEIPSISNFFSFTHTKASRFPRIEVLLKAAVAAAEERPGFYAGTDEITLELVWRSDFGDRFAFSAALTVHRINFMVLLIRSAQGIRFDPQQVRKPFDSTARFPIEPGTARYPG